MIDEIVSNQLNDSILQLLHYRYEQIVEVNLSQKYCHIIWTKNSMSDSFYVDELWEGNDLYASDVKSLRRLHNIEYIKEKLNETSSICLRFRQKQNRKFNWMQIEVVPASDYSEDNIDVLMFIKNIEDSYGKEYKARKSAEKLAKTDSLTGYLNRLAFDKFCESCKCNSAGVAFIDLNCLKTVNDTEGHKAGDTYIKKCCSKRKKPKMGKYSTKRKSIIFTW